MNSVKVESIRVEVPGGHVYLKSWTPAHTVVDYPLLLLHDSLGSVAQWRTFPEELATQLSMKVIAYDRLGFGRSSARGSLPSFDFIAEESVEYFSHIKQQIDFEHYFILGHSVGGAMAVNIAARDPDCCAVITIAAQAFVEPLTLSGIQTAKQIFSQDIQMARLARWHGDKAPWVLRAWVDVWLAEEFAGWSLASCISHVKCPVLALHGDSDEYGSIAFPKFITDGACGVSIMQIIECCGHVPHKEKPKEVIQAIREFLIE